MKLLQINLCSSCEEAARAPGHFSYIAIRGSILCCVHTLPEESHAPQEPSIDQTLYESEVAHSNLFNEVNPGAGG